MVAKEELKHGAYYKGVCRNADIARWNAEKQHFVYKRYKFGTWFMEEIFHPADDNIYDVFRPDFELDPHVVEEIPLQ